MFKLLFFCFQVTNSRLKNKKNSLRVTNSIGALLFSHFRVTNMKLMTWTMSFCYVFFYSPFFVVSICDVYLSILDFNGLCYFSNIFTGLQKTFSSCRPKEEWLHAGLFSYNGRQVELFRMKWCNCEYINMA